MRHFDRYVRPGIIDQEEEEPTKTHTAFDASCAYNLATYLLDRMSSRRDGKDKLTLRSIETDDVVSATYSYLMNLIAFYLIPLLDSSGFQRSRYY